MERCAEQGHCLHSGLRFRRGKLALSATCARQGPHPFGSTKDGFGTNARTVDRATIRCAVSADVEQRKVNFAARQQELRRVGLPLRQKALRHIHVATLETKAKFIAQVMSGDMTIRLEDWTGGIDLRRSQSHRIEQPARD